MQKRGQSEIWETLSLFEVLAGLAIASLLIIAALGLNTFTSFGRDYLTQDLKLISGAVSSSPASVTVYYPISSGYQVSFDDGIKINSEPSIIPGDYRNLTLKSSGPSRQGLSAE